MRARFVDWSRHQGQTNLKETVQEWGLKGLYARCTIGWSYKDPWYEWNFEQAREIRDTIDPEFIFCAYHVLWPWNNAPEREVDWFLKQMVVDGDRPDGIVDDIELPNDPDGWKTVSKASVASQIKRQLPYMAVESGLRVMVYTGSWWWNSNSHLGSETPLGIESDYPLIEAEYITPAWKRGRVDFSEAPEDTLPAVLGLGRGWSSDDLVMWQWTSGLRPVGVQSTSQDGDVLIPSYEDFRVLLGMDEPPLTTEQKVDILWENHPEYHP
jgi:hypothetical protein